MGPHAQIISVSTISAAHARILLVPLQLIPQTVALVKDVLFHEITSIFCDYRAPTLIFDLAPHFCSFSTCCLCGKQALTLTARHLAHHEISVEDYKKLCGYEPTQKLMAREYLAKMTDNAKRAQEARAAKRMEKN